MRLLYHNYGSTAGSSHRRDLLPCYNAVSRLMVYATMKMTLEDQLAKLDTLGWSLTHASNFAGAWTVRLHKPDQLIVRGEGEGSTFAEALTRAMEEWTPRRISIAALLTGLGTSKLNRRKL